MTNVNQWTYNKEEDILPPHYPLKDIKTLLGISHYKINSNALQTAYDDFGWMEPKIVKCLQKLNDRDYCADKARNHFYKTEPHNLIPHTKMDYYKMQNAPEGFQVYTHLYVKNVGGKVVISSFKEL